MAAEYSETEVEPGDTRGDILETMARGNPFAFIVATDSPGVPDGFNITVEVGGGIADNQTLRRLLEKSLEALP